MRLGRFASATGARRPEPDEVRQVAAVTQRLAVLLAAGVAPTSAWEHVAVGTGSEVPGAVVGLEASRVPEALVAAAGGRPALERGAWRGLAAAWAIATDAGAPLAASLASYAAALRSLAQAQRDVRVALAGPVATARIVMTLPAIGVLFGLALGFNTLGTLFTTVPGLVCLVVGIALIFAASRWNRRLVAGAQPTDATPGLDLELMAIAVSGGGSLDRAVGAVRVAGERFAIRVGGFEEVLDLSRRAGIPASDLLRAEADELRREARAAAEEKAAALSVRLMLPLGLCVLPAFMALGVLPLLITVISSTVGSF